MTDSLDNLVFREVDRDWWGDFERLLEGPSAPKYCWCMAWRDMPTADRNSSEAKKTALQGRVREGVPIGILGYLDGVPVAWCSIAPRDTYRAALAAGMDSPDADAAHVWSLVCFYVPRGLRGQGIVHRLITAAIEYSRSKGATVIEAYPVDPDSPSYRFMGFVSAFEAAGFQEVGLAGSRRHVMRLAL